MVSEPTSSQSGDKEVRSEFTKSSPAEGPAGSTHDQINPAVTSAQPRWMTITVALSGIIGLVVMILLVRG